MAGHFPKGWFDISKDRYADLGAMLYLSALTRTHNDRSLPQAIYTFEPPWRLNQYHIFRQNGYPRGFVTYAGLSTEAERRYAIDRQALTDKDFASGTSFWIIDLVAPFGQFRQIVDILKRDIPYERLRANRMDSDMTRERIVEWTRDDGGKINMRLYKTSEFDRMLSAEEG